MDRYKDTVSMNKQDTLKQEIIDVVLRAGIAIRAEKIADRVAMPAGIQLDALLNELVTEGRLVASYTLQVNGERAQLYNVRAIH